MVEKKSLAAWCKEKSFVYSTCRAIKMANRKINNCQTITEQEFDQLIVPRIQKKGRPKESRKVKK